MKNNISFNQVIIILCAIVILLVGGFVVVVLNSNALSYIWEWITIGIGLFTLVEIYKKTNLSENIKIGLCFLFAIFFISYLIIILPIFKTLSHLCPYCGILKTINYII